MAAVTVQGVAVYQNATQTMTNAKGHPLFILFPDIVPFQTRFGLQDFAGNYSHNMKFSKTNWMCRCENEVEAEGHIVSGQCTVYGDLKSQFGDLTEDKNLVQYFQAVLDRRDILEEEDRRQQSSTAAVGARTVSGDRDRTSQPGTNIS